MKNLKFNSFQIKLFMMVLMVLDHISIINNLIPENLALIFHIITRVVGVWFAYTAVEGFLYTSNLKKYIFRLFSWSVFISSGNYMLNILFQSKGIVLYNNIFLTLALGVLTLAIIKNLKNNILKYSLAIIILFFGAFLCEGGMVILPFMLITYFSYGKNKPRNIGYIILSIFLLFSSFVDYGDIKTTLLMLAYNCDFMFILVLPFIYLYNGKRGNNSKFSKYLFYIFYPAHLWIIATIAYIVAK